jgi:phosphopantothenoylcysteine synthetase/decarboxylase
MHLLVTAGNTLVLLDRVRCLTNIFTGRTGTRIALHAHERGHHVMLLTSHAEVVLQLSERAAPGPERWQIRPYRTFDDLCQLMEHTLLHSPPDVVIHSAAVSDYLAGGIYAPGPGTSFHPEDGHWERRPPAPPLLVDRSADKVKSDEPELWLRLVRAPKLIDQCRTTWRFEGVLVKFKLEVGFSDEQLLDVAERSRRHSAADLMVANTVDEAGEWAFLGPLAGRYERVSREKLAARLLDEVERLHEGRAHG